MTYGKTHTIAAYNTCFCVAVVNSGRLRFACTLQVASYATTHICCLHISVKDGKVVHITIIYMPEQTSCEFIIRVVDTRNAETVTIKVTLESL